MVIKREGTAGVRIKIKQRKLLILLSIFLLSFFSLVYIFFFTEIFSKARESLLLRKYDDYIEIELGEEERVKFEEQQIENAKGYRIVKSIDMTDNSVTPLLSLEELSIRGYEVQQGVISLDMIWHRVDEDISFTSTAEDFILNEVSYDPQGNPEITNMVEVDSSSNLENLLDKGLVYSGNFMVKNGELTEELVERYINGKKDMEVEITHLTRLPAK